MTIKVPYTMHIPREQKMLKGVKIELYWGRSPKPNYEGFASHHRLAFSTCRQRKNYVLHSAALATLPDA